MPTSLTSILHLSAIKSWGGGEQQLAYLYQELAKNQLPQLILCQKNSALADYCKAHGFNFIALRIKALDIMFAFRLARLCKAKGIDVIHAHDAHSHTNALLAKLLFGLKAKLVISRKVAFTVNNSWLSRYKYNSPHIQNIICISKAVQTALLPLLKTKKKLRLVYDGVDLTRFISKPNAYKLRQNCNVSTSAYLIGTCASLVASKNLKLFIQVAKYLLEQGIEAKFIIIGDGPLRQELISYAQEMELGEHVIFLGFRQDVADLLPQLDVFLFTSQQEGMGSVILEAMAANIPVVSTRVGGIPELISDGDTGILAAPSDVRGLGQAVLQLCQQPNLRQRMVSRASAQLESFSIQAMANKTLAIYHETKECS